MQDVLAIGKGDEGRRLWMFVVVMAFSVLITAAGFSKPVGAEITVDAMVGWMTLARFIESRGHDTETAAEAVDVTEDIVDDDARLCCCCCCCCCFLRLVNLSLRWARI